MGHMELIAMAIRHTRMHVQRLGCMPSERSLTKADKDVEERDVDGASTHAGSVGNCPYLHSSSHDAGSSIRNINSEGTRPAAQAGPGEPGPQPTKQRENQTLGF